MFAGPKSPGLLQEPDRNPSPNDTWLTAAHIRPGIDTGEIVTKLAYNPLEDLGLFAT
jgi:hypothetical protein